ncbi:MAG: tetratricopeptide repeat protein [Verrucomicrobiales bacterium]
MRISIPLVFIALLAGCSAEAKKSRFTQRADTYFKAGEYEKAKIEYLNLLKASPQNPVAIERLGLIWFEQGAPQRALPFLRKTGELAPNHIEARTKLGWALFSLGGVAEARKEAIGILQQSPAWGEALILLNDTIRTPEELTETESQLQSFPDRDDLSFHLASARVFLRKKDLEAAENSLRQALARDPKSWRAHQAMGQFYLLQKEAAKAGEEFKMAAELATPRSIARLQYAEFLSQSGEGDKAKVVLQEVTLKAPDYLPAWRSLAQTAFAEKKYDESFSLLENIFRLDPENLDGRLLQGQVALAKGDPKKALEVLEALARTYPGAPVVQYHLARAFLQGNQLAEGVAALNNAVTANPDYTEAVLLLAEINLRKGDAQSVVGPLENVLKKRPELAQAQLLLAGAYRLLGRLDGAANIFRAQISASPNHPSAHYLLGVILSQQKKTAEARAAFEKAHEIAPDNLQPVNQLIDLDITEKNFESAQNRVDVQLQKTPELAFAHFLQGRVFAAQQKWDQAEAALLKTLELDPKSSGAYNALIAIYVAAKKLPQAAAQVEAKVAREPENLQGHMLVALIYDRMDDPIKARDAYEKLILARPDFPAAQNNLAYLYAERLNDLDKAFDLARKARASQPADPAIADTLGWIHYKRKEYQQALSLLLESAAKLQNNPEVQFHLGMAHYMMGQTEAARTALKQAAEAPDDFLGKAEAQRRLALLENRTKEPDDRSVAALEAVVKQEPEDVVARMRLAEAYEKQGAPAEAARVCEEALKLNPNLLSALTRLAQLNAGPLDNIGKALELARKARDLAPADPHTAGVLGGVAYKSGNFPLAYSLLREAASQRADDAAILYELALAAYSQGKVSEAQQAMQRSLDSALSSDRAETARSFLALTALHENPQEVAKAQPKISKALEADPTDVPALMCRALLERDQGDVKSAIRTYSEILKRFPDFAPAQKQLASLYLDDPDQVEKAHELALEARKALPDDPDVSEILAIDSFKRREVPHALQLFQEASGKRPLGARGLYYLGLCHYQSKDTAQSRDALTRAIAAGLNEPLAAEARRLLADIEKK